MMRRLPFALLAVVLLAGCAYPNVTLNGPAREAVPIERVQILNTLPPQAKQMGSVYAWSSVPVDSRVGYGRAVKLLQERAAGIGADAIYVPPFEVIDSPGGSRWVEPDKGRDRDGGFIRPTELMGLALSLSN